MVEEIIAVYTCEECGLDFPRMSQLDIHNNVIHSEGKEHPTDVQTNDIKATDVSEKDDATSFPYDMCERIFPKKYGRALHQSKTHNIKTINHTPGIVRQNSKKHMEIRLSLKCTCAALYQRASQPLKSILTSITKIRYLWIYLSLRRESIKVTTVLNVL